ncbi:MAG: hypothetical protein ACYC6G_18445 [Desulfobaccales bacterium]
MFKDEGNILWDLPPLERAKLIAEYKRIKIDQSRTIWITLSILIPLLTALCSIFFGIYNFDKQAKKDFEIKAIEIVMNSSSPQVALNKAKVLAEMFPDRLPKNFVNTLGKLYPKESE